MYFSEVLVSVLMVEYGEVEGCLFDCVLVVDALRGISTTDIDQTQTTFKSPE